MTESTGDFLEWLLGAEHAAAFWRDHWEKQIVVQPHGARHFAELLDLARLDEILGTTEFLAGNFTMSRHDAVVQRESYCSGERVDMQRALAEHRRGATITVRNLERWSRPLQMLCRRAQDVFQCPAQANVYMTPPSQQSTPPHWDTHDIFILQIHGEKVWRIYEAAYALPLAERRFVPGVDAVGALVHEFTLRQGDVLYLPRGFIHEPRAESYSVHVSLGVRAMRWVDLLVSALRLASDRDRALRETPGWHGPVPGRADWEEVGRMLGKQLASLAERIDAREVARSSAEELLRDLAPGDELRLLDQVDAGDLALDTAVGRRVGMPYQLNAAGDRIALRWATKAVSLPLCVRPVLEFMAERGAFCARDLPGRFPAAEKLGLVRALLDGGFLQRRPAECRGWSG